MLGIPHFAAREQKYLLGLHFFSLHTSTHLEHSRNETFTLGNWALFKCTRESPDKTDDDRYRDGYRWRAWWSSFVPGSSPLSL